MPPPHTATVHRVHPRNQRLTDALQLVLDLGEGLAEPTRVDLNRWLAGFVPEDDAGWRFLMITASPEVIGRLVRAIMEGPRAPSTLAVWSVLSPYVRRDTGEIIVGQRTLAKTAGIDSGDACRALQRLAEIGALLRDASGRYRLNPHYAWNGSLDRREKIAAAVPAPTPKLKLVDRELPAE